MGDLPVHLIFPIKGARMNTAQENIDGERAAELPDDEAIEQAFTQMEVIYKSRCVQPPLGKNVIVREIAGKEE
jgi:hypothetical protein